MRDLVRIPVYVDEFLFIVQEEFSVLKDEVDLNWISPKWQAEKWERHVAPRYDASAHYELHRLMKFNTCPFCRSKMAKISEEVLFDGNDVFVCYECFYWGGRGTRGLGEGPTYARGNLGRMSILENLDDASEDLLIYHLSKSAEDIVKLSPAKAEKMVPAILKYYLNCEVKVVGGVKDGGIDVLAIKSDDTKMIVQIKWREKTAGAEAVSVVREVGGTLLSRGIPSGMIVSTRERFSSTAKDEAQIISTRYVQGIGNLSLDLVSFNNIIDMFGVSTITRKNIGRPEEIIPYFDAFTFFG